MNLHAIKIRKTAAETQAAADLTQRNRSAGHSALLFQDTAPIIAAVAKGLKEAAPAKPIAPAAAPSDLTSVLKAMTDGFNKAAAAVRGSVQKAQPVAQPVAAPALPKVAPAPTMSVMLGSDTKRDRVTKLAEEEARRAPDTSAPMPTEAQQRRAAAAREEARKSAAKADAERVLVTRGGGRVRVLKALDPSLSDAAVLCLSHVVTKWEASDRQAVAVNAPDLSRSVGLPLGTAQGAYTELVEKGLITPAANSLGIIRVTPRIGAAGV